MIRNSSQNGYLVLTVRMPSSATKDVHSILIQSYMMVNGNALCGVVMLSVVCDMSLTENVFGYTCSLTPVHLHYKNLADTSRASRTLLSKCQAQPTIYVVTPTKVVDWHSRYYSNHLDDSKQLGVKLRSEFTLIVIPVIILPHLCLHWMVHCYPGEANRFESHWCPSHCWRLRRWYDIPPVTMIVAKHS